jgi:hypothetical protein
MNDTAKYISGLIVLLFKPYFDDIAKRAIAGFIALDNIRWALIYDQQMVVFKYYLDVFGRGQ